MSFYLTLPSNASKRFFPSNHPGHYTIKLPQEISLTDGEWEVGLSEILFAHTYTKIGKDSLWLKYKTSNRETETNEHPSSEVKKLWEVKEFTLNIPNNAISVSNEKFIKELNLVVKTCEYAQEYEKLYGQHPVQFVYQPGNRKTKIIIDEEGSQISFSPVLAHILGVSDSEPIHGRANEISELETNIHYPLKAIYLYSDLIRTRVVGDSHANLLRVLPCSSSKQQEPFYHNFNKIQFFPLQTHSFSTVEILLTTDTGHILEFNPGHTVVTLEFRKVKNYI